MITAKTTILSTIALFLMSSHAYAKLTTFELIDACSVTSQSVDEIKGEVYCVGYLTGVVDGFDLIVNDDFCLNANVDVFKVFQNVKKLAYSDKTVLNGSARVSIFLALKRMFPCGTINNN